MWLWKSSSWKILVWTLKIWKVYIRGKRYSIFSMLEAPLTIFYIALSNPTQQLKLMWKAVNLSEWSWKWRGQPSGFSVAEKLIEETDQKSLTGQDTRGDWIKTKASLNIYICIFNLLPLFQLILSRTKNCNLSCL